MEWLNYHHLLYFYTVAKEGRVSRAAKVLRLAQPTLSGQIRKLEHVLDEKRIGSISGRPTSDDVQTDNSREGGTGGGASARAARAAPRAAAGG
jgi:hypothetical protein